jgi:hypothetical protein
MPPSTGLRKQGKHISNGGSVLEGEGAMSTLPVDVDLEAAWWQISAEALAELALEDLPHNHLQRRGLTEFLETIRQSSAGLVSEYAVWRCRYPELTAGMVYAGQRAAAREACRQAEKGAGQ